MVLASMNKAAVAIQLENYLEATGHYDAAVQYCSKSDSSLIGEIYLEWAHCVALLASKDENFTLIEKSNELLEKANKVGVSPQSKFFYLYDNHKTFHLS